MVEFLNASFYMRSVSYRRKLVDYSFPELIVLKLASQLSFSSSPLNNANAFFRHNFARCYSRWFSNLASGHKIYTYRHFLIFTKSNIYTLQPNTVFYHLYLVTMSCISTHLQIILNDLKWNKVGRTFEINSPNFQLQIPQIFSTLILCYIH
jgi:hypothetical protein